jgi:amino acid transporter
MKNLGTILTIFGFLFFIYTGANFITQANAEDMSAAQLIPQIDTVFNGLPMIGVLMMLIGVILLLLGWRKKISISQYDQELRNNITKNRDE